MAWRISRDEYGPIAAFVCVIGRAWESGWHAFRLGVLAKWIHARRPRKRMCCCADDVVCAATERRDGKRRGDGEGVEVEWDGIGGW